MGTDQERFQLVCGVFIRATQIADTTSRKAFVEETCKDYPSLRDEVHALLRIYEIESEERMGDRIRSAIERAARDLLR